ncbi:hypothetical protein BOX15_Mlig027523g3 [Macrostomum lignano]|uniref:Caveolin n=1 Tax=Macrostomum lignano TaxID=282301 RepID=A0A267DC90_9PLAT|nr:hypothetical protein BOX15_Mlig027523g3 [Macrostomum lignano]
MAKEGEEAKVEVDLVNRDPNQLNGHLKVAFEDVLGEPEHAHSIDCLWRNSYGCFTGGKNCCYKFVSVLSGLCIALCWGCTFAMVAFSNIWCIPHAPRSSRSSSACSGRCGRPTGTAAWAPSARPTATSSAGSRSNRARLLPTARKAAAWSLAALITVKTPNYQSNSLIKIFIS